MAAGQIFLVDDEDRPEPGGSCGNNRAVDETRRRKWFAGDDDAQG